MPLFCLYISWFSPNLLTQVIFLFLSVFGIIDCYLPIYASFKSITFSQVHVYQTTENTMRLCAVRVHSQTRLTSMSSWMPLCGCTFSQVTQRAALFLSDVQENNFSSKVLLQSSWSWLLWGVCVFAWSTFSP